MKPLTDEELKQLYEKSFADRIKRRVNQFVGKVPIKRFNEFLDPLTGKKLTDQKAIEKALREVLRRDLTEKLRNAVGEKCPECNKRTITLYNRGKPLRTQAEFDHIVPLSQGGTCPMCTEKILSRNFDFVDSDNCEYCKLLRENNKLREEVTELRKQLNECRSTQEQLRIYSDNCTSV